MNILYTISIMIFCIVTVQCAELGNLKSVDDQVRDLIFADRSRFNHEDLMAFGLTCKSNDQYLRDTAQKRKNYFLILMPMVEERRNSFQWHGYGSRADRKKIVNDSLSFTTKKRLVLERLELSDNAKIHKYYGSWGDFESELSYKPVPFYSADKQLCFFGVGWENVPSYGQCGNVIRYSIKLKRDIMDEENTQAIRCMLCCCEHENSYNKEPLCIVLEFPHLLKSILTCNSVEKRIVPHYPEDDCYLVYHLDNIVVPDNYKEFVQYRSEISYKTFDALPEKFKQAIIQQYEKQKKQ